MINNRRDRDRPGYGMGCDCPGDDKNTIIKIDGSLLSAFKK
jgi:hypothetical protein